jgi:hypothetical protein
MTVIFVSTGVSTGLMVDKMMKVAPGGLVVPLLPKQTQLQVQNPRLDVGFGVYIALTTCVILCNLLWITVGKVIYYVSSSRGTS